MTVAERSKYLYYYCPVAKRKVELEEIVDPEKIPCKGEEYEKIIGQCVGTLKWGKSPHLRASGIRMRCRKKARRGTTVCGVHGGGYAKREMTGKRKKPGPPIKSPAKKEKFFKEEVLEKVEAFAKDPDLLNTEWEIAYLKSLLPRIESSALLEDEKVELLLKTLDKVIVNIEKREKIIEQRRYSIGIEKIQLLIKYVFEAVKRHVPDPNTLKKIGEELVLITQQMNNTDNPQQINQLLASKNAEEQYEDQYIEVNKEKNKKIKKKGG